MVFSKTVSTPANTLEKNAQFTPLIMFKGLIYHIGIYFPPGPSGYLHVKLQVAGHPFVPTNDDSWFIGDDIKFPFDDLFVFDVETAQLDILTYNDDTQYDHQVMINIGIVTEQRFVEAKAATITNLELLDAFNNLTLALTKSPVKTVTPTLTLIGSGANNNG